MKIRKFIDLSLVLIFIVAGAYLAYKYLGEPTELVVPKVQLEESSMTIDDKKVEALVRNTSASDSEDSWYPEVMSNRWKYIDIYQSGLLSGNYTTLTEKAANKNDCGIHFVITNGYGGEDGKVFVTKRWELQQDSASLLDAPHKHSETEGDPHYIISICMIGDFNAQFPTAAQISSLKGLLNYLLESTTVKSFNVKFHSTNSAAKSQTPFFLPLELIIKTRTNR